MTLPFHLCRVLLGLMLLASAAVGEGRLVASPEPGWPQWRGPRRDGICDETGLLQSWPEGGPKRFWTASGLGRGYSAPIITRGTLFITGDVGRELHIFAFGLDGKLKWQSANGQAWRRSYPGARAACLYDGGRLYNQNGHARVACLDASDGKEIWAVDIHKRFQGRNIQWGIAECPVLDGRCLILTAGGPKALVVALDKMTGETLWASDPLPFERTVAFGGKKLPKPVQDFDRASYASPILFELGGQRLVVGCSARHVYCVGAETGKLHWTRPMPTQWEVLGVTPVLYKDCVFVTGPDGHGGRLFRIRVDGGKVGVEEVWKTRLDTCHGGVVVIGDSLYGSYYRGRQGWACLDMATGKPRYETFDLGMGAVLYADNRLYCLSQQGEMALLEPAPDRFVFRGRFRLTDGKRKDVWPHPVILHGRLYLRYHDKLHCFDIKAP